MISNPKKIHIIGPVGSGKTYLAKLLSSELTIPFFQLDNFVWRRVESGKDIKNQVEERDKLLSDTLSRDAWIIEGAQSKWVDRSFGLADVIIYLEPKIIKRDIMIVKRFVKEKLGLEKGNYSQNIDSLIDLFKWNHNHNQNAKARIFQMIEPYKEKLLILKDNREIWGYLSKWNNN